MRNTQAIETWRLLIRVKIPMLSKDVAVVPSNVRYEEILVTGRYT